MHPEIESLLSFGTRSRFTQCEVQKIPFPGVIRSKIESADILREVPNVILVKFSFFEPVTGRVHLFFCERQYVYLLGFPLDVYSPSKIENCEN